MITALERVGDRILRFVLPAAEASACYTQEDWNVAQWPCSGGWCGEDDVTITCTSEQGCRRWGPGGAKT